LCFRADSRKASTGFLFQGAETCGGSARVTRHGRVSGLQEGTLLSLLITYPSEQVRDIVLGTGMANGMEASYVRLEEQVIPSL